MPGLVGFTHDGMSSALAAATVSRMQELLVYTVSSHSDPIFCDGRLCATRSHSNIIQKQAQPCGEDGVYVWLDGEFYNSEELRKSKQRSCAQPCGTPDDAALLLELYRRDKEFSFLNQIDGTYSAVVYDSKTASVHLISDRYGLRHLFWTVVGSSLVWASEVKGVLAFPGFAPKINPAAVETFFGAGHMLGDQTWLAGVELLPAATVMSWDIRTSSLVRNRRYWWWDEIKPLSGKSDEESLTEELGRLFRASVARRSRGPGRVGLTLSGGLDSRAILAAMPGSEAIHAVTFGKKICGDVLIAAQAASVKGVVHHTAEMNSANWLAGRCDGIWRTDGQFNLLHMNAIAARPIVKGLYDINLDGFLGDAVLGGSYIGDRQTDAVERIDNRGRRFISLGQAGLSPYAETRRPFFDNALMELTMAIPENLRRHAHIYRKMLLREFPSFFKAIAWQRTGVPITWPRQAERHGRRFAKRKNELRERLSWFGICDPAPRGFADYDKWIRQGPARPFFEEVLRSSSALYPEFISRERVHRDLAKHLAGGNRSEGLCAVVTFEIWLRQIFEGKYRPAVVKPEPAAV